MPPPKAVITPKGSNCSSVKTPSKEETPAKPRASYNTRKRCCNKQEDKLVSLEARGPV